MNTDESAALVRYVAAICPGQRIDDLTGDAWACVLDDVQIADAMEAATRISKRPQPFDRRLTISPDQIRVEVRKIRADRMERAEAEFVPTSGDPTRYIAELRAWRRQVADGAVQLNPDPTRPSLTTGDEDDRTHNRAAQLAAITDRIGDAA